MSKMKICNGLRGVFGLPGEELERDALRQTPLNAAGAGTRWVWEERTHHFLLTQLTAQPQAQETLTHTHKRGQVLSASRTHVCVSV